MTSRENTRDPIDSTTPLTLVRPGTVCMLIDVLDGWGSRHGRGGMSGMMRRRGRHFRGPHGHRRSHRATLTRLLDLGLTRGCTFEVIQSTAGGPVLVQVRGTRIALGHRLARRLLVREVRTTA